MIGELGLVGLMAVGSAFYSGSEIAVLSARRERLESQAAAGRGDARLAVKLLEDAPRTITAILVGTNLCNIGASSLATAVAVGLVGERGPLLATLVLTPLFLIAAEILPKALYRTRPTKALRLSSGVLRGSEILFAPLVVVATALTRALLFLVGIRGDGDGPVFRREDLENLFTFGEVREEEDAPSTRGRGDSALRMAARALDLHERRVGDAMVPLPEARTCPAHGTVRDARARFQACRGRFLAAVDDAGRVTGFLTAKSLLAAPEETPLARFVRPAVLYGAHDPLDEVIRGFRRHQLTVGLVRDAAGGTLGIVTPEDVFEEVTGEIPSADAPSETPD